MAAAAVRPARGGRVRWRLSPAASASSPARLGPTSKTASLSPDVNNPAFRAVTFDQFVAAYDRAGARLARGRGGPAAGRDGLRHAERQGRALRHRTALRGGSAARVPVMLSFTITDQSGRTLSGQTVEAFWNSVSHTHRCSASASTAPWAPRRCARSSRSLAELAPVSSSAAIPNAGLPNPLLPTGFRRRRPETMAAATARVRRTGWLNIVGRLLRHHAGAHPRHRRGRARPAAARAAEGANLACASAAWSALTVRPDTNFVNIGERTNVTGSPKFAKLILAGEYEAAL